jgi:hypothetical protein
MRIPARGGIDLFLLRVTALPGELSHGLCTEFACDNADCDAYGERIDR